MSKVLVIGGGAAGMFAAIFAAYNGNYNIYIKNSGKKLPRIMIMINNYEVLGETYESYIDTIASLSREGEKYGIFFVISRLITTSDKHS